MAFAYDTWGGSWGASWGISWGSGSAPPEPTPTGHGGRESFVLPYQRYQAEQYDLEQKRKELQRISDDLAEAESKKQQALAEAAALEAAALEANLQEEINRLRMERDWLMRQIDDEEAILVLMMSRPFH